MTVLFSALVACFFVAITLGIQIWRARARRARFKGLELRPNCLLTRHPIAFLSGPRHLFRLFDYWNDVPLYLREHGYEVFVIEPIRGDSSLRQKSLRDLVVNFENKFHLIADSSQEEEIKFLAQSRQPKIQSLTLISNPSKKAPNSEKGGTKKNRPSLADLKPHDMAIENFELKPAHDSVWALEMPFLDLAISLAERDINDLS